MTHTILYSYTSPGEVVQGSTSITADTELNSGDITLAPNATNYELDIAFTTMN